MAGEDLRYSLEDDLVFLLAIFFKKRLLCSPRSARALSEERRRRPGDFTILRKGHEEQEEVETKVGFGGSF